MLNYLYDTFYTLEDCFDLEYYNAQMRAEFFESAEAGLMHFRETGWQQGKSPSAHFDAAFYLASNEDVRLHNLEPLSHFIAHGQYEGRRPHPSADRFAVLNARGRQLAERLDNLVERRFYFSASGHPEVCDVHPVLHYFAYGYQAGFSLSPAFDPAFYLSANVDVHHHRIDPLLHYVEYGWRENRRSAEGTKWLSMSESDLDAIETIRSGLDLDFYLHQEPWIAGSDVDPAAHYYSFGEKAGKAPKASFSPLYYLSRYSDVSDAGVNAFAHYLNYGHREGREGTPTGYAQLRVDDITAEAINTLSPASGFLRWDDANVPQVYIIIPIYRGFNETLTCLKSALTRKTDVPFKIIALDDHSPDSKLTQALRQVCEHHGVKYVYNDVNLGFVGNVNKGFDIIKAKGLAHVLLLNADAHVYDHWLDRMVGHLKADDSIATLTPMSNNATIMSYPEFCGTNLYNIEISHEEIAKQALDIKLPVVDVITGVGFAMLISEKALNQVGDLDVEAFGKGYGEEVDFCQRARLQGFRNVAVPDVFVTHIGTVSFGEMQAAENQAGQEVLKQRYPDYDIAVHDFIHGDPLYPVRAAYDTARLIRKCKEAPFVLSISHNLGGGIKTYVQDLKEMTLRGGHGFIDITIVSADSVSVTACWPDIVQKLINLRAVHFSQLQDLLGRITANCRWAIFNSMFGAGVNLRDKLERILKFHAPHLAYVVHDFAVDCPRANFTDMTNNLCVGVQPLSKCQTCVRTHTLIHDLDVAAWRAGHRALLENSKVIVVPDRSVPNYLWHPNKASLPIVVRPHQEPELAELAPLEPDTTRGGKRVYAVVGAIGPHKGSRVLRALRDHMASTGVNFEIHVIGYTDLADLHDGENIIVHGKYASTLDAVNKLRALRPDAALSLSVWPETYCYTLSILTALGLPVVGFDIGAQGERLRQYSRAKVIDLSLKANILSLSKTLESLSIEDLWANPLPSQGFSHYTDIDTYFEN